MHAQQVGAPAPAADLSEALATLSLVNQAANQQTTVVNDALLQAIERLTAASQRNFQAMTEEMGKLSELVAQLKQQLKDQAQLHQDKEQALVELYQKEKQTSDAHIAALNEKVSSLSKKLSELEKNFDGHYHYTTTRIVVTSYYPDGRTPLTCGPQVLTTGPEGLTKPK